MPTKRKRYFITVDEDVMAAIKAELRPGQIVGDWMAAHVGVDPGEEDVTDNVSTTEWRASGRVQPAAWKYPPFDPVEPSLPEPKTPDQGRVTKGSFNTRPFQPVPKKASRSGR